MEDMESQSSQKYILLQCFFIIIWSFFWFRVMSPIKTEKGETPYKILFSYVCISIVTFTLLLWLYHQYRHSIEYIENKKIILCVVIGTLLFNIWIYLSCVSTLTEEDQADYCDLYDYEKKEFKRYEYNIFHKCGSVLLLLFFVFGIRHIER